MGDTKILHEHRLLILKTCFRRLDLILNKDIDGVEEGGPICIFGQGLSEYRVLEYIVFLT